VRLRRAVERYERRVGYCRSTARRARLRGLADELDRLEDELLESMSIDDDRHVEQSFSEQWLPHGVLAGRAPSLRELSEFVVAVDQDGDSTRSSSCGILHIKPDMSTCDAPPPDGRLVTGALAAVWPQVGENNQTEDLRRRHTNVGGGATGQNRPSCSISSLAATRILWASSIASVASTLSALSSGRAGYSSSLRRRRNAPN
jgi:hypothetical protein